MKTTSVFRYLFLFAAAPAIQLCAQSADTILTNVTDYLTLQTALDIAESNLSPDIISLGEGTISLEGLDQYFTYEPPARPEPSMEEHFPLTIQGAGPEKTIIDGAGSSIITLFTSRLSDDFGANITISGICFRNSTDGNATALGIGTDKAQIMVYNCRFVNCRGTEGSALTASTGINSETPGGIHVEKCAVDSCSGAFWLAAHAMVSVKNCTFTDNTDYPVLGCFSNYGAHVLEDNTFINNTTTTVAPVQCIILGSGEIDITKNHFSGGRGDASGGLRIGAVNTNITLFRNEFSDNHGTNSGGLYCSINGEGDMTLYRNRFTGNSATNEGGGAVLFTGVDVSSGETDRNSNVVVQSCLFARNKAAFGSSLFIRSDKGRADVLNCTFAADSVVIDDGGVLSINLCDNVSSGTVMNSLFNANLTKNGPLWSRVTTEVIVDNDFYDLQASASPDGIGAEVNLSHDIIHRDSVLIDSALSRAHLLDEDPLLDDSLRLTAGSPAIDAGSPAAHADPDPGKDCAGNDRSMDGDRDGNSIVDIGAFEYDPDNASIRFSRVFPLHLSSVAIHNHCYTLLGRSTEPIQFSRTLPTGIYVHTSPDKQPSHSLHTRRTP